MSDRLVVATPDADATQSFGERLGALLRAGDLLVLTGGLGAGKTTMTQGIARGLDVRGPITSPTFVVARVHPPLGDGPELVHVDAYRLHGSAELDDLDLDAELDDAVTIVEWGAGLAESLNEEYLTVTLSGDDERRIELVGTGPRWDAVLDALR
ncbi:tRNA (adenosine(37)-N6)-threonylcarbamoyltransferase complex ATPase subunit type 1 TsaE [Luteipulveratus flavus]|uniref:tRNA threonylcarbamoyladenosine biosynthesis protein TsaE n=1 Tax=Luteipulveratus flavus TaxID=3031728 RepID=A0ABT6C2L1_9MICO|nr:tRNA (adenosine(37)-N6)-threonylcarbamoyltransferase complex ATPase subunit type 1 TsaE [Luteipulveratus sp. YIM 133296]MDF8263176.1 tRNA (adenosine(37)-N6)-threonylcarbamoyltransferase complex ATPase subunit type 1 TsaE [Luteipulveratus sp. YIM 133296]